MICCKLSSDLWCKTHQIQKCFSPRLYWSQVLSREWNCSWSSADRRCSNYICVINKFIAYYGARYIRGLTVVLITLRSKRNGYDLGDDLFECVFFNEKFRIMIQFSLKCVPKFQIYSKSALVPIMSLRGTGVEPLTLTNADPILGQS